ncbi:hypothetical protein HC931_13975 [Candidatus Gracilibacteria bacterium]|jgi:hypothetical protein|nr:hypothetical protein [Candidatus Gracilibacteria bacterium]NJM87560.1 hypothetical protein [Hydrococcus sp. RU_2_2]NJP19455.1 hypothetical protein [Hydrococcus sp. CRU_1_1]NJQ96916.1 hypothetical protein [Hydrococcus sp. CSU_1_8]
MKKTIFLLTAIALALNACSTSPSETNPPQTEQNISEPSIPEVQSPEPLPLVVEPQFDNSMSSQPRVELKTQIGEDLVPQGKSSKSTAPEIQDFENPLVPKTQAPAPQNDPFANSTSEFGTGSLQSPSQNPLPEANNFPSPILTQPQAPIEQP